MSVPKKAKNCLVVLNIAGLSKNLLFSGGCPNMEAFARANITRTIKPPLPALTLPVQATFTTGSLPSGHGIVGNGYFDRVLLEHRFWDASSNMLDEPPFWRTPSWEGIDVGALFWWNCLGSKLHTYMNVSPIHTSDGKTVSSCYSDPPALYPSLEKLFGRFPLHRFWGPGISIESSKWILSATMETASRRKPHILLSYLPHMDYSQQRSGPGSEECIRHLAQLDDLLADPLKRSMEGGTTIAIISEYGISPVNGAVSLNRILKENGFFKVRTTNGREYPDLASSAAFAICDHQVAHVYVIDRPATADVAGLLSETRGVDIVLDAQGKSGHGVDHPRSGDLVALSSSDKWFDYSWWDDMRLAPEYAFTVDIHRKIGYDPLELFFVVETGCTGSDPTLIKGSHGLVPKNENLYPVLVIPSDDKELKDGDDPVSPLEIKNILLKTLEDMGSAG